MTMRTTAITCATVLAVGCAGQTRMVVSRVDKTRQLIVEGARDQLTWGTHYDPAYVKIAYPGGDPPKKQGVCTDVVIRAFRHAGIDLQKLIHEDMKGAWSLYPRYAGRTAPDTNIDHRRVPNQREFFKRHALSLSTRGDWRSGDIVEWKLDNGRDHTGIVTDRKGRSGLPLVIHNIGAGPQEEDVLTSWKVVAHFRYPKR